MKLNFCNTLVLSYDIDNYFGWSHSNVLPSLIGKDTVINTRLLPPKTHGYESIRALVDAITPPKNEFKRKILDIVLYDYANYDIIEPPELANDVLVGCLMEII